MANSPQARKRARQSAKRELNNASQRSAARTAIKKVLKAIPSDLAAAKEAFIKATKILDTIARRNIIPKNKAARIKSRLNKKLKAAAQ